MKDVVRVGFFASVDIFRLSSVINQSFLDFLVDYFLSLSFFYFFIPLTFALEFGKFLSRVNFFLSAFLFFYFFYHFFFSFFLISLSHYQKTIKICEPKFHSKYCNYSQNNYMLSSVYKCLLQYNSVSSQMKN